MVGMTVKELREAIKDIDDDVRVVLQSDAEGNGYRWARGAEHDGVLVEDMGWYAEIYNSSWDNIEADMDKNEWDKLLKNPCVLVIHPVN